MAIPSNNDVASAAEDAVKVAKQALGKTLDYSVNSLQDLDALIEHVKKQFVVLTKEGKLTEKTVQRATISMGSYFGEVIRRSYGGIWIEKNAVMKTLVIKDIEFSPLSYVFQRLIKNSEYTLENYWADLSRKLQSQDNPRDYKTPTEVDRKNTPPVSSKKGNRWLLVAVGIAGILCVVGVLAVIAYSSIKATNEFKVKLNTFLVEAEKLNVMTEQGVTYQEFRTQLIEVKSTYAAIDSWPALNRDEKRSFDLAIKGWGLTLDVWKVGMDSPLDLNGVYIGENSSLLKDICIYVGMDSSDGKFVTADTWLGWLMGKASTYFEAGKVGVK